MTQRSLLNAGCLFVLAFSVVGPSPLRAGDCHRPQAAAWNCAGGGYSYAAPNGAPYYAAPMPYAAAPGAVSLSGFAMTSAPTMPVVAVTPQLVQYSPSQSGSGVSQGVFDEVLLRLFGRLIETLLPPGGGVGGPGDGDSVMNRLDRLTQKVDRLEQDVAELKRRVGVSQTSASGGLETFQPSATAQAECAGGGETSLTAQVAELKSMVEQNRNSVQELNAKIDQLIEAQQQNQPAPQNP